MTYQWDITKSYGNRMGRYKTKLEFDFIDKYLIKRMDILDIGGGSGRFAIPLHQAGHNVTVIEKNDEAIDNLLSRDPNVTTIRGNFQEVTLHEKYDLIISIEVLLYVEDWPQIFQKVHGLLRDGGVFIFTATNRSSWRTKVRNAIKKDYGYTEMSPSEYFDIVHKYSFRIDRCQGFNWTLSGVNSNSRLVNVCSWLESTFRLGRWIQQSPWLLFAVRRD